MPDLKLDLSSSFDEAWARFQTLDALQLAGGEHQQAIWQGRAQQLVFIARVEDAAAREHIARLGERLRDIPGVELYPDWFWHITIKSAGFQVIRRSHDDDVLREDAPRLANAARAIFAREPSYDVRLGPVNAFDTVVICEVHDAGRTREINTRLLDGLPRAPRYPFDGDAFLPHVSVAYFTSNDGLAELKSKLAALRREGSGPAFQIRRIEFVKAWWSDGGAHEFDTLASYQLASKASGEGAP